LASIKVDNALILQFGASANGDFLHR